jgi:hypothetical protein
MGSKRKTSDIGNEKRTHFDFFTPPIGSSTGVQQVVVNGQDHGNAPAHRT